MAKTDNNIITRNYSGSVGRQFSLRTRGNKSILAALPKSRYGLPLTPAQQLVREKFQLATIYARKAASNPALMEAYEAGRRGNQSARNVAFKDAWFAPIVSSIQTDAYTGEADQPIVVRAIDNFRVTAVKVSLFSAEGTLLEEGSAVEDENGYDWIYRSTSVNPALTGTLIRAVAEDLPKNKGSLEILL